MNLNMHVQCDGVYAIAACHGTWDGKFCSCKRGPMVHRICRPCERALVAVPLYLGTYGLRWDPPPPPPPLLTPPFQTKCLMVAPASLALVHVVAALCIEVVVSISSSSSEIQNWHQLRGDAAASSSSSSEMQNRHQLCDDAACMIASARHLRHILNLSGTCVILAFLVA